MISGWRKLLKKLKSKYLHHQRLILIIYLSSVEGQQVNDRSALPIYKNILLIWCIGHLSSYLWISQNLTSKKSMSGVIKQTKPIMIKVGKAVTRRVRYWWWGRYPGRVPQVLLAGPWSAKVRCTSYSYSFYGLTTPPAYSFIKNHL